MVYDKSDKHNTSYDSHNSEIAATPVQSVALENIGDTYSITDTLKFDVSNSSEKFELFRQFFAWSCNRCSKAPLSDNVNNLIYQELHYENTFFTDSDERIYVTLCDSKSYTNEVEKLRRDDSDLVLKIKKKKKMCLRVWGYLQGEYPYLLTDKGLTMKYKNYTIAKEKIPHLKIKREKPMQTVTKDI